MQRVQNCTPETKAQARAPVRQQQGQTGSQIDKEDLSCVICYKKAVDEAWVDRFRFVPGAKVLCPCGGHKGCCFPAVKSQTVEKYKQKQMWLQEGGEKQTGKTSGGASGWLGKLGVPTTPMEKKMPPVFACLRIKLSGVVRWP